MNRLQRDLEDLERSDPIVGAAARDLERVSSEILAKPTIARPAYKFVGGKTQLLPELLKHVPERFGTYFEPFFGGGALFWHLASSGRIGLAWISDRNELLIRTLRAIRDRCDDLCLRLSVLANDEQVFRKMRERGPDELPNDLETAVWFLYLNKTCFSPGSLVLTEDERYVPIESVGVGQRLWNGRVVKETLKRQYCGEILRIHAKGSPYTMSVTADHPVLSIPREEGKSERRSDRDLEASMVLCPASDLRVGDWLLQPKHSVLNRPIPWGQRFVDGYVAVQIGEINSVWIDGVVHNLEVDGDHLLCVDNAVSHNCFNGLYRVNKKGRFNVPFGKYANPKICDAANLRACSAILNAQALMRSDIGVGSGGTFRAVTILAQPFEDVRLAAQAGDLVYLDPPYPPVSKTANFTSYTEQGFRWEDQERLRDVALEMKSRGVFVILSNSDQPRVRELYADPRFSIHGVKAKRAINSKGDGRGDVGELIVT